MLKSGSVRNYFIGDGRVVTVAILGKKQLMRTAPIEKILDSVSYDVKANVSD